MIDTQIRYLILPADGPIMRGASHTAAAEEVWIVEPSDKRAVDFTPVGAGKAALLRSLITIVVAAVLVGWAPVAHADEDEDDSEAAAESTTGEQLSLAAVLLGGGVALLGAVNVIVGAADAGLSSEGFTLPDYALVSGGVGMVLGGAALIAIGTTEVPAATGVAIQLSPGGGAVTLTF